MRKTLLPAIALAMAFLAAACLAGCSSAPPKPTEAAGEEKYALDSQAASPAPPVLMSTPARAAAPSPVTASVAPGAPPAQASVSEGAAAVGDMPEPEPVAPSAGGDDYKRIVENPFLPTIGNPLSTFSVDVDTASYANARRFITEGSLPPPDAVRVEEFVNYFTYDYPDPSGAPVGVTTELAPCPWNPAHQLLMVGMKAKSVSTDNLPPANLVFLLDVSGSMYDDEKLPLVKKAFRLLIESLRPQDTVAIAVYAGAAGLVLKPTSGADKQAILDSLDGLEAGGSTAGSAGIQLAYETALASFKKGGNNRVILATDGDFNVGPSSESELLSLIESYRNKGVFLTVLGFGHGNFQDAKMEAIADKGNGTFAYVDSLLEAKKLLVSQMGGTLLTVAKDVKIQVEFNPAYVKGYRLVGYENRLLAAQDFRDDRKDAGEMGSGHTVTAFYEIIPAGSDEAIPGADDPKYQAATPSAASATSGELATVRVRYKKPDQDQSVELVFPVLAASLSAAPSVDFRFASSVVSFGLLLRGSEYRGNASYATVLELAQGSIGADTQGWRKGFVELVRQAQALAK